MRIWKDNNGAAIKVDLCAAELYVVRGIGQLDRQGRVGSEKVLSGKE